MLSGAEAALCVFALNEYLKHLKRELASSRISESAAIGLVLEINQVKARLFAIIQAEKDALERVLSEERAERE